VAVESEAESSQRVRLFWQGVSSGYTPVIDNRSIFGHNNSAMDELHINRIRRWMKQIVSDGGVERLDDLHVDAIDKRWKERSTWLSSGLDAFGSALLLRDELRLPFKVTVAFPLNCGTGDHFESVQQFERELHYWTPPSLYLLPHEQAFFENTVVSRDLLPKEVLSQLSAESTPYLSKWKDEDGDQRTVFIAG
jgi:hypothetical protein